MKTLARTPQQIGNAIRRARKKRGWSQGDLGGATGFRQGTISFIESGNPAVKLETLLSVIAALDMEFQIWPRSKQADFDIRDFE